MSAARTEQEAPENVEAIDAWNGPLFDRFVEFREILCDGLGVHGDAALDVLAPQPGEKILDVGCGFGDTTLQIAALVGASGEAVGVDAAPRFIETATAEAAAAGVTNARYLVVRCAAESVRRPVRPRLLTLRHDVLRQPGGGASQRATRRSNPAAGW